MLDSNVVNNLMKHSTGDAKKINAHLASIGASLVVTWIQVQESFGGSHNLNKYQKQLKSFIKKGNETGLVIHKIPAEGLYGVRGEMKAVGLSKMVFFQSLIDDLIIREPHKSEGNLARDAAIGTTSLECSILCTSDRNFRYALKKTIAKTNIHTTLSIINAGNTSKAIINWLLGLK